jgi:hypothetical protein
MTNSPKSQSWRDVLPIHPAAELFPPMSESELRELGEDIKKNGLTSSIVLFEGKLLDGRNRLDAIELLRIEYSFLGGTDPAKWHGLYTLPNQRAKSGRRDSGVSLFSYFGGDPYAFVLSANIHRRHLTTEQKRELIVKLLKAKPEQSDRQIAKQTKTSPTTVGTIRKKAEATGDVSKLDTRTDTKGRKQPSVKPQKPAKATAPRDIALDGFSALPMELDRLTRNESAGRFAKTSVSDEVIRRLAKLFSDLINIRNEKVVDRICGSAEISTEQHKAEHAALDGVAS